MEVGTTTDNAVPWLQAMFFGIHVWKTHCIYYSAIADGNRFGNETASVYAV